MEIFASEKDFTTSVRKAFDEIDPKWEQYIGLVIVGSHTASREDAEAKIQKIKWARENNIPFLGVCYGFQLAAIEYARSVLGLRDADTQELDPDTKLPLIQKMDEMRVGQRHVILYGKFTLQSFWHRYKFNPLFLALYAHDWWYSFNKNEEVLDYMILRHHFHFVITQFHPEYQSTKDQPHVILKDFLEACRIWQSQAIKRRVIGIG